MFKIPGLLFALSCASLIRPLPMAAQQPLVPRIDSLPHLSVPTLSSPDSLLKAAARQRLAQARALVDTAIAGSMLHTLDDVHFQDYIKKTISAAELKQFNEFKSLPDSGAVQQYFLKKAGQMRSRLQGVVSPETFLRFGPPQNKLQDIGANVIWDDLPGVPLQSKVLLHGNDRLTIANIPFDMAYNNLFSFGGKEIDYLSAGVFKLNFSREGYLQQVNAKLNTYYDLKKYFLKEIDLETAMKQFVDQRVSAIRTSLDSIYGKGFASLLPPGLNVDQLVQLDTAQLKRLFSTEEIQATIIAQGAFFTDTAALRRQAKDKALREVLSLKKELESGEPARRQLVRFDQLKGQLSQWMNTDESRIRNAKELFPLGGLQRFFLRVKELNIGSFNTDASAGSVAGLLMNGAGAGFFNKGKMLMLGAGVRTDGLGMKDAFLTDNIAPSRYALQYARFGKGDLAETHSHLTVLNASTKDNTRQQINQQFLSRNIFVGTVSQQLELGEYGVIKGDFSKSNSSFGEVTAGNNGYAVSEKAAALSFFNDFWQTVSVGLRYSGQVPQAGLTQRAYLDYAGMGYNNPGTPFGSRGTWKYGFDLKRRWRFHHMSTGLRMDFRDIHTAFDAGWRNRQYAADLQFRVKRNWNFTTRMMQSSMKSTADAKEENGFLTRQVSLTSQYSGHMGSLPASNLVTAGLQQMRFTTAGVPLNSTLINVNMAENIVIDKNLLSVNFFYNRDLQQNALYSNLLNMDAGWSYMLFKTLSCSSGLTFLDNKGLVTQGGIKQTLAFELIPKVQVNIYTDCRKNFYSSPQNYLFGTFRSEFSLQYLID